MKAVKEMTMAEIEKEIDELTNDPMVKLGRKQKALQQKLYHLRHLQKCGMEAVMDKVKK